MERPKITELYKNKKRSVHLEAEEKLNILKQVDEGRSIPDVGREYNVGATTLRRWVRNRAEIEEYRQKRANIKHIRSTPNQEMNEAVKLWYDEMRLRGFPISGPMLRAKAIVFHNLLGLEGNFVASEGWLDRWKKNFGIRQLFLSGENLTTDTSAENFKSYYLKTINNENLGPLQQFNAAETILNYKMMPNQTPVGSSEKCRFDRFTVMPCSNADGSFKLPLVVIGNSNISNDDLPVYYTYQKSGCMSSMIFEMWFKEEFIPRVTIFLKEKGLPLKAVLLLSNTLSHPSTEILSVDGFKVLFLPSNITSLIQPMDQGIITTLKRRYRRLLVSFILNAHENNFSVNAQLKSISKTDAISWLSEAWQGVSPINIYKCWQVLLPDPLPFTEYNSSQEVTTESLLHILQKVKNYENVSEETVENWLTHEDNLHWEEEPSDEEILSMINYENSCSDDEYEPDDKPSIEYLVTAKEAESGANCLIVYLEQNGGASSSEMAIIRRLKNKVIEKKLNI